MTKYEIIENTIADFKPLWDLIVFSAQSDKANKELPMALDAIIKFLTQTINKAYKEGKKSGKFDEIIRIYWGKKSELSEEEIEGFQKLKEILKDE